MLEQTAIFDLLKKVEQINENEIWREVAAQPETQEAIAETQREQLRKGERPDGSSFPDYSDVSVNVYGKPAGAITWYDDGEFYDSIGTTIEDKQLPFKDAITTGDNGEKINLETDKNEVILGIQENNFEQINEAFRVGFIEKAKQILGIG
jgi:hypothetical protein